MAMASQQRAEFEEAITCPVCFTRYDEKVKKPKYLVSCCHTICIACLERICAGSGRLRRVMCPICRGVTTCSAGVESLPTNHDKLYLLKLEQPLKGNDECMNWCFTCKKMASQDCSVGCHSVITVDSRLLNSDVQLNMRALSSRLQACNQSILHKRIEIGLQLEQISRWLTLHQEMITCFMTKNSSRISELNEMVEGSDITISIQQLMQLSLNQQQDLTLLSDTLEEELAMKEMIKEFDKLKTVEAFLATSRFNGLLDLPSVPRIRKEMDCHKLYAAGNTFQWPMVFIESLAKSFRNPTSKSNDQQFLNSPHTASRYFESRSGEEMIPSPTMSNSTVNTRNSPSGVSIFRFGAGSSQTGAREKLSARRRRPPSNM